MELSIDQAKKHSADFMYIWADENKFLRYIPKKYASVIRVKKANQQKLLRLSAEKYKTTYDAYTTAIRQAFIDDYAHTPAEALVILAQGGQIAGKNWKEGVYGIGSLSNKFSGATVNDAEVTVDQNNGHIYAGGKDITDTSKTVYNNINGNVVAYQLFSIDDVITFMSQYNKTTKKYYAQSYVDADGNKHNASGATIGSSDAGSIWESIILSLETFINWIISIFGGDSNRETINAGNTLPNQQADGFVQEAGMGEAGGILLVLAAGGALMASGVLGKKRKISK